MFVCPRPAADRRDGGQYDSDDGIGAPRRPAVSGAASVTVRTPTAATVTIEKVTVGNTNVPVNFLAVAGQMDVTVNVDPGDFILSKVELLIDGVVCPGCTQSFTAAQSQALSAAAVYGDDVAGAVSQILFSVQTATFNTTTGVANWLNTTHVVSARATLTNAGQSSTAASNRWAAEHRDTLVAGRTRAIDQARQDYAARVR